MEAGALAAGLAVPGRVRIAACLRCSDLSRRMLLIFRWMPMVMGGQGSLLFARCRLRV
jgi:hypothetical protein